MTNSRWKWVLLVLLTGALADAGAAEVPLAPGPQDFNPNVEEYIWKEGETVLPGYPEEKNLQFFSVDQPQKRFNYFLDRASLSIGEDAIVRYTIVVRSLSGGENVMFEGVRCQTKEYKGYAFGNGRGAFRKASKPIWRKLDQRRHNLFRHTLVTDYLCSVEIGEHTAENILKHMQYDHRRIREERI